MGQYRALYKNASDVLKIHGFGWLTEIIAINILTQNSKLNTLLN